MKFIYVPFNYWAFCSETVRVIYVTKSLLGKIAERSRASKTLAVEQEVPSSNPGDFVIFQFFVRGGMAN